MTKMGYWTDPVFSKPKKAKKTSWWSQPVGSKPDKVKVDKCPACGKGPRQCRCSDVGEPVKTRGRTVRTHDRRDDSGVIWCGVCRHRCNPRTGVCMNVTCSSRRK